ncbi:hypothetical protein HZS_4037 [Henneguya salminicola]|nr:hypothetical protein HZS_4037 [Henneguya salminicola]
MIFANLNISQFFTIILTFILLSFGRVKNILLRFILKILFDCPDLVQFVKVDTHIIHYHLAERNLKHLKIIKGGKVVPECKYDYKVAIIIPLRNRESQLVTFLNHMHPILYRQNIYYQIFSIVQSERGAFNRAKLFNVGFVESNNIDNFDCFIFHDVDFLLLNDYLKYSCQDSPSHFGVAASQFNYELPYSQYFGGVAAITKTQYIKINGFSNCYWGYGGEDDDLYRRCQINL